MPSTVTDNSTLHHYELTTEGVTAFVKYRDNGKVRIFVHTEVPAALGGKGVGSQLAKGALDLARAQGLKIVPECPFIAAYIRKHPEYQDLVAA